MQVSSQYRIKGNFSETGLTLWLKHQKVAKSSFFWPHLHHLLVVTTCEMKSMREAMGGARAAVYAAVLKTHMAQLPPPSSRSIPSYTSPALPYL